MTPKAVAPPVQPAVRRTGVARPTCTHVIMDKLFGGGYCCQMCNKVPSIGWVYVCQTDTFDTGIATVTNKTRKRLSKVKKQTAITELELLGFNKSITKAAELGHYDHDQLETLKRQKRNARSVIEDALQENETLKSKNGPSPAILTEKLAALGAPIQNEPDERKQTLFKDVNFSRLKPKSRPISKSIQPCEFRVCHTCRPLSRDRSFVSFEAVFNGDVPSPPEWTPDFMPIANARFLRRMSWGSHGYAAGEQDEDDAVDVRPHKLERSSSSRGFRESLEQSFGQLLEKDEEYVATVGGGTEGRFDLDLWKTMIGRVQDEAAATRLPGKESDDSLSLVFSSGDMEEEQVDGGVALTEEAVASNTPDLILGV